jgi:hypothetical protein
MLLFVESAFEFHIGNVRHGHFCAEVSHAIARQRSGDFLGSQFEDRDIALAFPCRALRNADILGSSLTLYL